MHKKLRKDKNCLNCGQIVDKRFCTSCGQENLELHDSTPHLIIHYLQDLVHYDGRFWHTIKNLFLKPGFVAKEYIEGRRVRNLDPIRFYVFASTVFFIIFFATGISHQRIGEKENDYSRRLYYLNQERTYFNGQKESAHADALYKAVQQQKDSSRSFDDIIFKRKLENDLKKEGINVNLGGDSLRSERKGTGRAGGVLERVYKKKEEKMTKEYSGSERAMWNDLKDGALHKLPQVFFISLPFFAFFLWMLHRKKTRKRYSEHFIFSIYHYSFVFVITLGSMLLGLLVNALFSAGTAENIMNWSQGILFIYLFLYLIISMQRFYNQSFKRALAKGVAALVLSGMVVSLLVLLIAVFLFML